MERYTKTALQQLLSEYEMFKKSLDNFYSYHTHYSSIPFRGQHDTKAQKMARWEYHRFLRASSNPTTIKNGLAIRLLTKLDIAR